MLIIFHLLLILRVGRCTDHLIFETKTVGAGDDVKLSCNRLSSDFNGKLYWIRLVSGNVPEFLGGTHSFEYDDVNKTPHFTTKQEPGVFALYINKTERNNTGFYYCLKTDQLEVTFLTGIFLRIKGPQPDITSVIHVPPSDPVRPGDSVTLQCSVFSDSEKKTCPVNHSVYWFRAGSDESHPTLISAHGNTGDECEKTPEAQSPQKCVYSFSKNVSSSDSGTYYCAVATCGEIFFGNGTKLDIEGASVWSVTTAVIIILLCVVLVISLTVTTYLVFTIKTKCDSCNAAVDLKKINGLSSQQRNEDTWIYSAVVFNLVKSGCCAIKDAEALDKEKIYVAMKVFGVD